MRAWSVLSLLLFVPGAAPADELIFKNGDRLTGSVVGLQKGTVTFQSATVGKVTASVPDLAAFHTDREAEIRLIDGTRVKDRIVRGDAGKVHLASAPSRVLELAQIEAINPQTVAWHGSVAAGLTIERGDTDSQDANVEFKARWMGELYRFRFRVLYESDRSRSNGREYTTDTRLYRGRTQVDRLLSDRLFVYGRLRGERDGTTDVDLRTAMGAGLGYKLVDRPDLTFEVQGGLAWSHEDYKDNSQDTDFPSASIIWDLRKPLRTGIQFFHDGEWSPSVRDFEDIQLLNTETGLRIAIAAGWFTEAKVRWELDTEPSRGKERLNTDYLFSLGWGF